METKSIQERAKKYADSYLCEGDLARAVIMSYSQGATEQREIDIQRAVDAHCTLCKVREICEREQKRNNCTDIQFITRQIKGE